MSEVNPGAKHKTQPVRATLPEKSFLYTLDQVAQLLGFVDLAQFKRTYVFFEGVSYGGAPRDKLRARDIAPEDSGHRDWRVNEDEFVRWMHFKKWRVYRRTIRVRNPFRD